MCQAEYHVPIINANGVKYCALVINHKGGNIFVHCILVLKLPKKKQKQKPQTSQALDGATFYLHGQETQQDQLQL